MDRRPLYYTFGNHMHWVDMQWLWGYDVLPGSVRDMLRLCRETGARGCVNFDGVGYEKMAAESPDALADLREAVRAGTIEPVGCSYGQPYGLFQGGESNVRQFTFGVRSVLRLLGVRPRTFWEEEFYFFPQLPQVLASCGFTGANLFFQWTWHTPEVPRERASLILWEGVDGTRLPTLPRNELNVHQWPEDFDGLLEQGLIRELDAPAIVQWLELMPSRDWMCRSEVLLPRLRELFADPRFELRPRTCGELIAELGDSPGVDPPVRAYTMDDVWHGMTLGKNGDRHPMRSKEVERTIVAGEALASALGAFGRPYASWDVYPSWELDEAWRELLAAQHHDNHECEGLCGAIAEAQENKADWLAEEVLGRCDELLSRRISLPDEAEFAMNALGWPATINLNVPDGGSAMVEAVPPFGHAPIDPASKTYRVIERATVATNGGAVRLCRGDCGIEIDSRSGSVIGLRAGPAAAGQAGTPLVELRLGCEARPCDATESQLMKPRTVIPKSSLRGGSEWSRRSSVMRSSAARTECVLT